LQTVFRHCSITIIAYKSMASKNQGLLNTKMVKAFGSIS